MASDKQVRELLRRLAAGESPAKVADSAKRLQSAQRFPREGTRRFAVIMARELGMSPVRIGGRWEIE